MEQVSKKSLLHLEILTETQAKISHREYGSRVVDVSVTDAKMYNIALERLVTTTQEIERLQTELETLRDWKTPKYSEKQKANFEESCVSPPKLFIEWHWLPEVPEPESDDSSAWVNAAVMRNRGEANEWQEMILLAHCPIDKIWFFHSFDEDVEIDPADIAGWYYEPTEAPPKPEAEPPAIELGDALTSLEQAAITYFGLDYAESGDGSGDWFVYAPMPDEVKNDYQGSSCECLSDVVEEYQAAVS